VGAGVTALQTSANPYVSILGPEHSPDPTELWRRLFNSIGGTIAPLVAGAYILTDPGKLGPRKAAIANTVRVPYILLHRRWPADPGPGGGLHAPAAHLRDPGLPSRQRKAIPILSRSIWSYKHTVLGAVGIFFYVGVEVGLASIAVNYFKIQGVSTAKTASFLVSLYWAGALVGRLLGAWVHDQVKPASCSGLRLCRRCTAHRHLHVYQRVGGDLDLVLCGFFNSIMFPNIFTLGNRRAWDR
jgi:FHS family L-fucose permease-like MFS transporter